jgi:hypothetical protein
MEILRMLETLVSKSDRLLHPIKNLDNFTVLRVFELINGGRFQAILRLFERSGVLKPPFDNPILDRSSILHYLQEEYRGVKFIADKYRSDSDLDHFLQITVLGKMRIPWFGSTADIPQIWRFFLLSNGMISLLTIDTLLET